jgi:hypothetical protein
LREAAQQSFVYPVPSADGPELWYAIHGGRVRAVLPAPHDDETRLRVRAIIECIYPKKTSAADTLSLDEIDGVLLVASWFRRNSAERQRQMTPAAALTLCS